MKTKTEIVLIVLKYLALLAAVGFSIEWGKDLFFLVASLINPEWAKNAYGYEAIWYQIRNYSEWYYIWALTIIIAISVLKSAVWYLLFDLLHKLELKSPFTMDVTRKLETISYLLLGVWILSSFIMKTYAHYLLKETNIEFIGKNSGDEYLLIAGIVYIISKIFKRGIEMQEENQLTV